MIEHLLSDWGLPAVVLGSLLEGEGAAFLGGVLAHRHLFPFEFAALAAALGAFLADQGIYWFGRHAQRFGPARRALETPAARGVMDQLRRREVLVCLGFRFVYGMKTLGALSIGAAGVPPWRFAALDAVAVMVWAHLLVALGYGAGRGIERLLGRLELHLHLAIALVLAIALWAAFAFWRRRRSSDAG